MHASTAPILEFTPAHTHRRNGHAEVATKLIKSDQADHVCGRCEMRSAEGWSPDQILFRRKHRPLASELGGYIAQIQAEMLRAVKRDRLLHRSPDP